MKYPCRVQVSLSPTAFRLLTELAEAREEKIGETARYGLTVWLHMEERKQNKRRDAEQRLLTLRHDFMSAHEQDEEERIQHDMAEG